MSQIIIMAAILIYLAAMLGVGFYCSKQNNSVDDFYLGGRKLGPFVTAMSAEASDMSSWLLMGLPGTVYALGTGQSWIAIGLFLGTVCNWVFISSRLRKYTIRANNSLTLRHTLKTGSVIKEGTASGIFDCDRYLFPGIYSVCTVCRWKTI